MSNDGESEAEDRNFDTESPLQFQVEESELVIGLVGPVGADMDAVVQVLERRCQVYGFEPNTIRLSNLLSSLELETELAEQPAFERYSSYMNAGNEARESAQRGDFLALAAAYQIAGLREDNQPMSRHIHLLRSLKHPEEAEALRAIYGNGFFLIGVHAPRETRRSFLLEEKGVDESNAELLMDRDEAEEKPLGQRTRDTFALSDAFISLDGEFKDQLGRILGLLFGQPDVTPTIDERAMFHAYAASLRSGDLSRQVGAVILSKGNEIIATGANDVPKYGGGLYGEEDEPSGRDWERGYDSNHQQREEIAELLVEKLAGPEADPTDDEIRKKLEETGILDITEYGRAVHAEMEALLSCTRVGQSAQGGTLYCTTFPCHNCAKHIVGAGIYRVVYVEPYPKSKALDLHDDSLSLAGAEEKVSFEPFVGVGPRRFIDLFSLRLSSGRRVKRKTDDGTTVDWQRADAIVRVPMAPLSYLEREQAATAILDSITGARDEEEE